MDQNKQQFHRRPLWDRCSGSAINQQQAALWRQQTQAPDTWGVPGPQPQPLQSTAETSAAAPQVRNPWLEALPQRPKKKRRGVWAFVALVAIMVGVVGIYWYFVGPTFWQDGSNTQYYGELDASSDSIGIPTVDGGSTQLTVQREHGEVLTAQEIYQKVNPAVVTVVAVQGDGSAAVGTGVLFTGDGFFLTNAHVIDGSESCMILLSDGRRYEALLVGYDRMRDVAVLKAVDAVDLPTAEIGDSTQLLVGDKVYAIGNPLGLELRGTLTDGIVSAINRDVQVDGRTMTLIQTNAALNEGNSGGPLINEYGQVIGLNVVKMSAGAGQTVVEGLGFAVPSETFEYLANQILAYGAPLPDTSLGITVTQVGEEGAEVRGLLVYEVTDGSCAGTAGVRPGDVILAADGRETLTTADLLAVRRSHAPGEEMTLTILRGGDTLEIVVILDAA